MFLGKRREAHRWNDKVTNELFLWKKFVADESPAATPEPDEEDIGYCVSKAMGPFLASVERRERPTILDLGPVTNCNLSFYGDMGWKVYAFDLLQEYREAVEKARLVPWDEDEGPDPNLIGEILVDFQYERGSLNGVLCRDVLDKLPPIWLGDLLRRLSLALEGGGVIFSMFGMPFGDIGGEQYRGFRIREENRLEPIPDVGTRLEPYQYENGDIMSLFSDFKVLYFFFMKNNVREMLVQKQLQASHKEVTA